MEAVTWSRRGRLPGTRAALTLPVLLRDAARGPVLRQALLQVARICGTRKDRSEVCLWALC